VGRGILGSLQTSRKVHPMKEVSIEGGRDWIWVKQGGKGTARRKDLGIQKEAGVNTIGTSEIKQLKITLEKTI